MLTWILVGFLICFYLPTDWPRFKTAVFEALVLTKWYAREHVLLCLVPAFFIAGAVGVFIKKEAVMKYLGANAPKPIAYAVASVSGSILAVCSCTILPLFSGIYRMGAGLGPACAFLYSGPAINVLAIILTARILGMPLGIARAVGAILFSVVIGLVMHFLFRKEEQEKMAVAMVTPESDDTGRPLYQTALFFAAMIGVLVFANWGAPKDGAGKIIESGLWYGIYSYKWLVVSVISGLLAVILATWYQLGWLRVGTIAVAVAIAAALAIVFAAPAVGEPGIPKLFVPMIPFCVGVVGLAVATSLRKDENGEWFDQSWFFCKQIMPLLLGGVLVAGLLLGDCSEGKQGHGLIEARYISDLVGGNSLFANFFASLAGALMYFATLTEVPIIQGLQNNGMGNGPTLALLLAGPALSLPNMLVINTVLGPKKTFAFVSLVVVMATLSGLIFGNLYPG